MRRNIFGNLLFLRQVLKQIIVIVLYKQALSSLKRLLLALAVNSHIDQIFKFGKLVFTPNDERFLRELSL